MKDTHGRQHRDLRVSLTDRCSLRCTYCMPAEGLPWIPGPDLLTADELLHLVALAVEEGITAVRLTGGEPLLHPQVVDIVRGIVHMPGSPEVSLTTNALRLPALAGPLADAGLTRVNISLDTLDRDTFIELAKRDRLIDTLAGITAAQAAGLQPVKINSVLLRGINDHEAADLLTWAVTEGLHLRFIEQMPLDPQHGWRREEMVTADEILDMLSGFDLEPMPGRGSDPAQRWLVDGGPATVGVIASVTRPFCGACDRVRLTADGQWRNCLFAHAEADLRTPLRNGGTDEELRAIMRAEVRRKLPGHGLDDPTFLQPARPMSAIGG